METDSAALGQLLLGTWFTPNGSMKVRFSRNGLAHCKIYPWRPSRRDFQMFFRETYKLDGNLLTFKCIEGRGYTKDGVRERKIVNVSTSTEARIRVLTADHLICNETVFLTAAGERKISDRPYELVRTKKPYPAPSQP